MDVWAQSQLHALIKDILVANKFGDILKMSGGRVRCRGLLVTTI